jgi:hypothetical protein
MLGLQLLKEGSLEVAAVVSDRTLLDFKTPSVVVAQDLLARPPATPNGAVALEVVVRLEVLKARTAAVPSSAAREVVAVREFPLRP